MVNNNNGNENNDVLLLTSKDGMNALEKRAYDIVRLTTYHLSNKDKFIVKRKATSTISNKYSTIDTDIISMSSSDIQGTLSAKRKMFVIELDVYELHPNTLTYDNTTLINFISIQQQKQKLYEYEVQQQQQKISDLDNENTSESNGNDTENYCYYPYLTLLLKSFVVLNHYSKSKERKQYIPDCNEGCTNVILSFDFFISSIIPNELLEDISLLNTSKTSSLYITKYDFISRCERIWIDECSTKNTSMMFIKIIGYMTTLISGYEDGIKHVLQRIDVTNKKQYSFNTTTSTTATTTDTKPVQVPVPVVSSPPIIPIPEYFRNHGTNYAIKSIDLLRLMDIYQGDICDEEEWYKNITLPMYSYKNNHYTFTLNEIYNQCFIHLQTLLGKTNFTTIINTQGYVDPPKIHNEYIGEDDLSLYYYIRPKIINPNTTRNNNNNNNNNKNNSKKKEQEKQNQYCDLIIVSFGEYQPSRYVAHVEGIWEIKKVYDVDDDYTNDNNNDNDDDDETLPFRNISSPTLTNGIVLSTDSNDTSNINTTTSSSNVNDNDNDSNSIQHDNNNNNNSTIRPPTLSVLSKDTDDDDDDHDDHKKEKKDDSSDDNFGGQYPYIIRRALPIPELFCDDNNGMLLQKLFTVVPISLQKKENVYVGNATDDYEKTIYVTYPPDLISSIKSTSFNFTIKEINDQYFNQIKDCINRSNYIHIMKTHNFSYVDSEYDSTSDNDSDNDNDNSDINDNDTTTTNNNNNNTPTVSKINFNDDFDLHYYLRKSYEDEDIQQGQQQPWFLILVSFGEISPNFSVANIEGIWKIIHQNTITNTTPTIINYDTTTTVTNGFTANNLISALANEEKVEEKLEQEEEEEEGLYEF